MLRMSAVISQIMRNGLSDKVCLVECVKKIGIQVGNMI